jgi:NDP-sugar pyrophosphorylase family protein
MIVNYKKGLIKAFFEESCGHDIVFTEEKDFLGTGGGLMLVRGLYDSTFFMTNCDILVMDDYGEILRFHREQGNLITLVCAITEIEIPYGTIELSDKGFVTQILEKPVVSKMVNTGLYVIEPRFLDYIPNGEFVHITDIIEECVNRQERVGAYPISERSWMDMGHLEKLDEMKKYLDEA